jgi:hypothetical protein
LTAGIGVVNNSLTDRQTSVVTRPKRHLQRVEHKTRLHRRIGFPANDPPGENVDHERDIAHTRPGADIREIGDP